MVAKQVKPAGKKKEFEVAVRCAGKGEVLMLRNAQAGKLRGTHNAEQGEFGQRLCGMLSRRGCCELT